GSGPPVKDMRAKLVNLGQQRGPSRGDIIGMIMSRGANRSFDLPRQSGSRNLLGLLPSPLFRTAVQRAVAYKGELAHRRQIALIDDPTYGVRKSGMANPVQDNLRDRATSGHGFVTRLIIDRLSQAKQRTPLIERLARREHESASWSDRRLAERHCGIDQLRFLA